MTLIEAKDLAQQGIKVTHRYFTSEEYMIMKGNRIVFEDGNEIMFNDWVEGKDYLNEGWSLFEAKNNMSNLKNLTIEDINEIMEAIDNTSVEMYSSEFDEIKVALMNLVFDKKQS